MMLEIEHKFLVDLDQWEKLDKPEPVRIEQGFIAKDMKRVVRVRIKGNQGFLTIKGKNEGISRQEFEYEIPLEEAVELLNDYTPKKLSKDRYEMMIDGKLWEIDVFLGKLAGLVVAELEVSSEDEVFTKPDWVTEDVSRDPAYYNAVLIDKC